MKGLKSEASFTVPNTPPSLQLHTFPLTAEELLTEDGAIVEVTLSHSTGLLLHPLTQQGKSANPNVRENVAAS